MRAIAAEHDARVKQAAERGRRNLVLGSVAGRSITRVGFDRRFGCH